MGCLHSNMLDNQQFHSGRADLSQAPTQSEGNGKTVLPWNDIPAAQFFYLSPVPSVITTQEGRFLAANAALEKALGYESAEFHELSVSSLYANPLDRQTILSALKHHGAVQNFNVHMRRRDGSVCEMKLNAALLKINGHAGILKSFQDVSDLSVLQAQLEVFANIVDEAPGSITVHDSNGRFLYANQKTLQLHGYTLEEFLALDLHSIDTPESAMLIKSRLQEIAEKGEARFDVCHNCKDGSVIPMEVSIKPVNWMGKPAMLSIALDLTERNRYEQSLRDARDAAQAANRAKSFFLANMSHEIRTPMNAIMGFTELARQAAQSPDQRRHLDVVSARSEDLLLLINDILDLSKIEAGRLELQLMHFSLAETLGDVVRMFELSANNKGLRLELHIDPGLDSGFLGDARRLRQVMVNLLSNAIKFTPSGSVIVRAKPEAPTAAGELPLHITVEDTGVGISQTQMQSIFEPFSQKHSPVDGEHGGTGLGLAICNGLMKMMGGRIWCVSGTGKGSVFHVALTLLRDKTPQESAPGAQPPVSFQGATDQPRRFLVVDDDTDNRDLTMEILRRWGHKTEGAVNGQEALEKLQATDFDMVLMDIKMPGLNGIETTQRIRDSQSSVRNHRIPIIGLTAFAMKQDEQACMESGMDGYLAKPITASMLDAVLSRVFASRPRQADCS